jgi:thymidylate synthase ThyX
MNGTMRSWIFYLQQRLDISTQKEHREIAQLVLRELRLVAPVTINAFFPETIPEETFSV